MPSLSVYTATGCPEEPHTPEEVGIKEEFALDDEDCVMEQLSNLDIRKCMGPDGPDGVEGAGGSHCKATLQDLC